MHEQNSRPFGEAKDAAKDTVWSIEPVDGTDLATVALDGSHLAEQVRAKHGRIVFKQAVAARGEVRLMGASLAKDPVSKQPVPAGDEDDLARDDFLEVNPLDGQQVTRLDGGQHARTGGAKSDPAEPAHDFHRQLDPKGVPRIGRMVHERQRELRILSVGVAGPARAANLAAGQRHRLEDAL